MKKMILLFILLINLEAKSQSLSNPSFENWASASTYVDLMPENWWSFFCNTVTATTDSYQGVYASKIQGMFSCGIAPGILVNGMAPIEYGDFMSSGTPFTAKPSAFSGFYKYTDVTLGDSAEVTVVLKRYNSLTLQRDTVSISTLALPATNDYAMFTVNLPDLMPGISPDSIIVMFNSSKYYMFNDTSFTLPILYVDRILMSETPNSILEQGNIVSESLVYPNPFSERTTIEIKADLSNYDAVDLNIFDVTGRNVLLLEKARNPISISKNALMNGNYFFTITSKKHLISSGKLTIQ